MDRPIDGEPPSSTGLPEASTAHRRMRAAGFFLFFFFSLLFLLNFVNFGYFGYKPEPNRKEPNRIFSVPISEKNRSVPVS